MNGIGVRTTGYWMDGENLIERQSFDAEAHLEHAKALHSCGL